MNWPWNKPKPNPARELALVGVNKRKARIRAVCDQQRAAMGLPAANWPKS